MAEQPISLPVVRHSLAVHSDDDLARWRGVLNEGEAPKKVLVNIRDMAQLRIRNPQWARLYCELQGWVGTRENVIRALVVTLGVPLDQARSAVELVMGTSDDPHETYRQCKDFCAWYEQNVAKGGKP